MEGERIMKKRFYKSGILCAIVDGDDKRHYAGTFGDRSGIKVRDRYHSPFKEELEAKYTDDDWNEYMKVLYKERKAYEPIKCKETARRWRDMVS